MRGPKRPSWDYWKKWKNNSRTCVLPCCNGHMATKKGLSDTLASVLLYCHTKHMQLWLLQAPAPIWSAATCFASQSAWIKTMFEKPRNAGSLAFLTWIFPVTLEKLMIFPLVVAHTSLWVCVWRRTSFHYATYRPPPNRGFSASSSPAQAVRAGLMLLPTDNQWLQHPTLNLLKIQEIKVPRDMPKNQQNPTSSHQPAIFQSFLMRFTFVLPLWWVTYRY